MPDLPFRFGNEVYTWFMKESGAAHAGRLDHMIDVTARAGLTGIEPIFHWMTPWDDPEKLGAALHRSGVELAAVALVLDWNHPSETDDEHRLADEAIALLKRFPGALLCAVQAPTGRHNLEERRRNLVANVNAVARRAHDAGVGCTFHPNSPPTSINRTTEDYKVILNGLDASVTGWTPDVGHIANGGMDPLEVMRRWRPLINHVHYKDWNGDPEFCLMGEGSVDLVAVTRWLREIDYRGWVICEDESEQAIDDPDGVTLHDGRWVRQTLLPELL